MLRGLLKSVPVCAAFASLFLIGNAKAASVLDPANGLPGPVSDDPPLVLGGGWEQFSWNGAAPTANNEGAYTFTSTSWVTISITDWRVDGDQFKVVDNGHSLGLTSTPHNDNISYGDNIDADFANPALSHGTFLLAPGSHSIVLDTVAEANNYCYGEGFIKGAVTATPTVPLPNSALGGLMMLGLLGAAKLYRRGVVA